MTRNRKFWTQQQRIRNFRTKYSKSHGLPSHGLPLLIAATFLNWNTFWINWYKIYNWYRREFIADEKTLWTSPIVFFVTSASCYNIFWCQQSISFRYQFIQNFIFCAQFSCRHFTCGKFIASYQRILSTLNRLYCDYENFLFFK